MKSKFLSKDDSSSEDYEKFEMSDEGDSQPYQKRQGPTKDQQIYGSFLDVNYVSNNFKQTSSYWDRRGVQSGLGMGEK